jgi:hypothetical protein
VSDENQCTLENSGLIEDLAKLPEADIVIHPAECDNISNWVEIIPMPDTSSFLYSMDNGKTFTPKKDFHGLAGGNYILHIKNQFDCENTRSFTIQANDLIHVDIDSLIYTKQGQDYLLTLKIDSKYIDKIDSIIWSPYDHLTFFNHTIQGLLNPTLNTDQSIDIDVKVLLKNDCEISRRIQIIIEDSLVIYVANVIWTEDLDGNNSNFTIYSINPSNVQITSLKVYDRWGNKVFDRNNFPPNQAEMGWNGTFNGVKLNLGVFVWLADLQINGVQRKVMVGDITLVK